MTKPTGPTARRRIIAAELRRLRTAGGQTQQEVAEAVGIGANTLSRYEGAETSMPNPVGAALFRYYGVDGERLDALLAIVKESRKRGWLADIKGQFWQPMEDLVALERDASSIQELAIQVIPGLLQTEGYARAILSGGMLGTEVEQYVEARLKRAASLSGDDPAEYWVVVREAALRCAVGGKKVMRDQLNHLRELAQRPNITLQVLPDSVGEHPSMITPFSILRFNIAPDYGVVYMDYLTGSLYLDEPNEVGQYDGVYRHLIKTALPEKASVTFLANTLENLYQ